MCLVGVQVAVLLYWSVGRREESAAGERRYLLEAYAMDQRVGMPMDLPRFLYPCPCEDIGWSCFVYTIAFMSLLQDSLARPREVRGAAPDWLFYDLDRLNSSLSLRTVLSGSERIAADGSNPLRMSQMPSDSSQRVSGIAMRAATGETCS